VREENPTLNNLEFSILLGEIWKAAPEEVKKKFQAEARQRQTEFKRRNPEYCYRRNRNKARPKPEQDNEPAETGTVPLNGLGIANDPNIAVYQQMWQLQYQQALAKQQVQPQCQQPLSIGTWTSHIHKDTRRAKKPPDPTVPSIFTTNSSNFDLWSDDTMSE
jgi:hypothetical protein